MAAADERINRLLADAVERHATKVPGTRGILKRAGVVCHPESGARKKIALDTEHDWPPRTPVSHGGQSGSGARPSDTASRHWRRDGRDSADENSAGHQSSSGSDSRSRITTKREPREVRGEQWRTTEQHVARRITRKTTRQEHAVAVTTQEALDGYREKTMRIANVEDKKLNWVSISQAVALHDAMRLQRDVGTG